MIDYTLQVLGFIIASVIFWRTESLLNLMSKECVITIRFAFWLIVVGAASINLAILQGYVPSLPMLIPLAGVTLLLISERRVSAILRLHRGIKRERRLS